MIQFFKSVIMLIVLLVGIMVIDALPDNDDLGDYYFPN
jgi:hypothetical protein